MFVVLSHVVSFVRKYDKQVSNVLYNVLYRIELRRYCEAESAQTCGSTIIYKYGSIAYKGRQCSYM